LPPNTPINKTNTYGKIHEYFPTVRKEEYLKGQFDKVAHDYFSGTDSENHPGIDFVAKKGTPVVATASGFVKAAKEKGELWQLIIEDFLENSIRTYLTHFGHMSPIVIQQSFKKIISLSPVNLYFDGFFQIRTKKSGQ